MALSNRKKIFFTTFVVGVFGVMLLIGAELWLAVFHPQLPAFLRPDQILGTMHFSNYTVQQDDGCIEAVTRFNNDGMNDVEHTVEKPAGTYRIAVIGDSYVEAMQFPLDQAYFRVLERRLKAQGKNVEVLAFGVGGFGTLQAYHLLNEYALKYQPDLVILSFFTYNDVRNNSFELERSLDMPYARLDQAGNLVFEPFTLRDEYVKAFESPLRTLIFERSHLVRFIYRLSNHSVAFRNLLATVGLQTPAVTQGKTKQEVADELYLASPSTTWEEAWRVTEALIQHIETTSSLHGADFLLFSLSNDVQLSEEAFAPVAAKYPGVSLDPDRPEKRLKAFSEAQGIRYLSALPAMRVLSERGVVVHPSCHGHWSPEASLVAGEVLSRYVLKQFLDSAYTKEAP